MKLLSHMLFLLALAFAGACSLADQPAQAQQQPCQWNYTNVGQNATATYCGNIIVNGTITTLTTNFAVIQTMADLKALTGAQMAASPYIWLKGFNAGSEEGAGEFTWVLSASSYTPNGGTIIPPSDHTSDCNNGCLIKADFNSPWLEDFGFSINNTGAQNLTAWNLAYASSIASTYNVGAGTYNLNGPASIPSNYGLAGRGTEGTKISIANQADGIIVGNCSGGTSGSHIRDLKILPTWVTTLGNGGIGIKFCDFDQSDDASNITVQPAAAIQTGGTGIKIQGGALTHYQNLTANYINGKGIDIEPNPAQETSDGILLDNPVTNHNADVGLYVNAQNSVGLIINAPVSETNDNTNSVQIELEGGGNVNINNFHVEGLPFVASGYAAVMIGETTPPVTAFLSGGTTQAAANNLSLLRITQGTDIYANIGGGGLPNDTTINNVYINSACVTCAGRLASTAFHSVNNSGTSVLVYAPSW